MVSLSGWPFLKSHATGSEHEGTEMLNLPIHQPTSNTTIAAITRKYAGKCIVFCYNYWVLDIFVSNCNISSGEGKIIANAHITYHQMSVNSGFTFCMTTGKNDYFCIYLQWLKRRKKNSRGNNLIKGIYWAINEENIVRC